MWNAGTVIALILIITVAAFQFVIHFKFFKEKPRVVLPKISSKFTLTIIKEAVENIRRRARSIISRILKGFLSSKAYEKRTVTFSHRSGIVSGGNLLNNIFFG